MSRLSKMEWTQKKEKVEVETKEKLKESDAVKTDARDVADVWRQQGPAVLVETVEQIKAVSQRLGERIHKEHGQAADKTKISIQDQAENVSNPAREGEKTEKSAADHLRNAPQGESSRFSDAVVEAEHLRDEAAEFLDEIAREDEQDQESSLREVEGHEQQVEEAEKSIREFEA